MRTFGSSMLAAALILGAWHTTSAQGITLTCSSRQGDFDYHEEKVATR